MADNKKNQPNVEKANAVESTKNTTAKTNNKSLDLFLWIVLFFAIALAVGGNYYFSQPAHEQPLYLRITLVLVCIAIGFISALCTTVGKRVVKFAKESRGELRKVTWPTRDETTKSTAVVGLVVFIIAMFLWVADVMIGYIVQLITNA